MSNERKRQKARIQRKELTGKSDTKKGERVM
jgi:hypothetical protein